MTKESDLHPVSPMIGLLAVKNQLITQAELEKGLIQCKEAENVADCLKQYLLSSELVSAQNIQRLSLAARALDIRKKEVRFGAIAVQKQMIHQGMLQLVLEEQQADMKSGVKPRLIGDMLVESCMMTEGQRDYILKIQKRRRQQPQKPAASDADTSASTKTATDHTLSGQDQDEPVTKKHSPPAMMDPEVLDYGIRLQLAGDYMGAFLTKTQDFNPDVTVADIRDVLAEKGIVSGIVSDEMMNGFIQSSGFKTKAFRVAKGIRPIQGKDARVSFFFNTDYLGAGGLDADGNIDFKQRGGVPHVQAETVLVEKIPMVESRPGHNIFGENIEAVPGNDIPLRLGNGAKLSEDGLKVLSDVTGFPKFSLSGIIYVHEEYTTEGDVDYETGHIEYAGNVKVNGCIKSGFRVKGYDITCEELDGGIVTADGNVTVTGGINEATIYARGNVTAKFIHKSEIICMGNVHVAKEIVDGAIECSGSCIIESGRLISSHISAKMGMTARDIGTQTAAACVVQVGQDAFYEKEIKNIQERITALKEKIAAREEKKNRLKEQNLELQKLITKLAHIQDRSQLDVDRLNKEIKDLQSGPEPADAIAERRQQIEELETTAKNAEKQLDQSFEKSEAIESSIDGIEKQCKKFDDHLLYVLEEKKNLTRWSMENPGNPVVRVDGSIHPGTIIKGKQSDMVIKDLVRRVKIMEVLKAGSDESHQIYELQVTNL
ncbi:MAG: FapA family protein [Desulfotignum sp.]|nr:FapA family protein [Desulfobacteraceae bacterium]